MILERGKSASFIVRTAICVEPRGGKLHVFMPPLAYAEDYLDLVYAVEQTATHLQMPVVIEGYLPPHDYRLTHLRVTPDPGVIEVNLQPADNWKELVHNTTTLYGRSAAHAARHRKVHARRSPYRNRRRQSHRARRLATER